MTPSQDKTETLERRSQYSGLGNGSADITTQQYWNLANHILKLQGLRKDKTTKWFGAGDSRQDIHFIQRNLRVIDDVVLVCEGGRLGWKRVDLVEVNFIVP